MDNDVDIWEEQIKKWLTEKDRTIYQLTTYQILKNVINLEDKQILYHHKVRLNNIMKKLGYKKQNFNNIVCYSK